MLLDSSKFPPYLARETGITTRAQRGIRTLSPPKKLTFEDVKASKLSTYVETADQFADDLIAAARKLGTDRAKKAADVLGQWDRAADNESDGTRSSIAFCSVPARGSRLSVDTRSRAISTNRSTRRAALAIRPRPLSG